MEIPGKALIFAFLVTSALQIRNQRSLHRGLVCTFHFRKIALAGAKGLSFWWEGGMISHLENFGEQEHTFGTRTQLHVADT